MTIEAPCQPHASRLPRWCRWATFALGRAALVTTPHRVILGAGGVFGAPHELAEVRAQERNVPGTMGGSGIWEASDHASPAARVDWAGQPASDTG